MRQVGHSAGSPPAHLGAVPLDQAGVSASGRARSGPVLQSVSACVRATAVVPLVTLVDDHKPTGLCVSLLRPIALH